jgi:hypothetical protein
MCLHLKLSTGEGIEHLSTGLSLENDLSLVPIWSMWLKLQCDKFKSICVLHNLDKRDMLTDVVQSSISMLETMFISSEVKIGTSLHWPF